MIGRLYSPVNLICSNQSIKNTVGCKTRYEKARNKANRRGVPESKGGRLTSPQIQRFSGLPNRSNMIDILTSDNGSSALRHTLLHKVPGTRQSLRHWPPCCPVPLRQDSRTVAQCNASVTEVKDLEYVYIVLIYYLPPECFLSNVQVS